MAIREGVTEIPDSEDEPLSSSPEAAAGNSDSNLSSSDEPLQDAHTTGASGPQLTGILNIESSRGHQQKEREYARPVHQVHPQLDPLTQENAAQSAEHDQHIGHNSRQDARQEQPDEPSLSLDRCRLAMRVEETVTTMVAETVTPAKDGTTAENHNPVPNAATTPADKDDAVSSPQYRVHDGADAANISAKSPLIVSHPTMNFQFAELPMTPASSANHLQPQPESQSEGRQTPSSSRQADIPKTSTSKDQPANTSPTPPMVESRNPLPSKPKTHQGQHDIAAPSSPTAAPVLSMEVKVVQEQTSQEGANYGSSGPMTSSECQDGAKQAGVQFEPPKPTTATIEQGQMPVRSSQETTLAELKAQRAALIASLAVLPNLQELTTSSETSEAASQSASAEMTDSEIMAAANRIVKKHIKLLHEYNEIKDVGQGLMGLIAEQRGARIVEIQDEFGISPKD